MNKFILYPILALSLMFSQLSFADADKSCAAMRMKMMVSQLNLTSDQQAKIKTIKDQAKETMKSSWQQMKAIRSQIKTMVQSDKIDEAKLDDLINQKKELMATMMKTKVMAKNQIYNILTETQKTQFQGMMKQWEEKRMMCKKC